MNVVIGIVLFVLFLPVALVLVGGFLFAAIGAVWASWKGLYELARDLLGLDPGL